MNDGTRNLYIYGAQSIAHGMACALRARGCAVAGYVVTERGAAPAVLDGLPVHEIGELRDDDAASTFLRPISMTKSAASSPRMATTTPRASTP